MEAALRKSVHGDFMEEKKSDSSSGDDEGCSEKIGFKVGNYRRREQNDDNPKDITNGNQGHGMPKVEMSPSELHSTVTSSQKNQEDRLKSAKTEMGEVMEDNQRLKMYLGRIMKDYKALQMQFHDIVQQENNKPSGSSITTQQETDKESEFVSLSLGRSSSTDLKKDIDSSATNYKNSTHKGKVIDHEEDHKVGLALGLDCKFEMPKNTSQNDPSSNPSPETSLEEVKEDGSGEKWTPKKGVKTARTGEDEVSHEQNPTKRARVSVRVRCDTPTMNDGCQWRKYGQKIAKGNPCPRAYYRCTVAPNCPVRKQVQRCAEDMSILITTYEGTHNHELPMSATAMASTTSAAASMLISGSSSTTSPNINGLNFYPSDNSKPKPFYLPNNSSISSTPSLFPTITLDLTTNSSAPRYSTTNLSFNSLESSSLPISWSNGNLINEPYNNYNNQINSLNFGVSRQSQENLINYQSYLQKNILNSSQLLQSQFPPETLAAATKAITNDPSFQSALAVALSTIIASSSTSSNGNSTNLGNQVEKCTKQNLMKSQSNFPLLSSFPSTSSNGSKCAPIFMNKPSSAASSQLGNSMFMSPSLPFSSSNGTNSTSGDNRDHIS